MLTETIVPRVYAPWATRRPPKVPPAHRLTDSIDVPGALMPFGRDAEIYGENEPAEYLYKVISGAVRTYKILTDGRRQIQSFQLPGDVFGFEFENVHTLSAEAIIESRVLVVKRSAIQALAARDNEVARELWSVTARELQRVQRHVTLLIKNAQERVVSFLFEMADRAATGNAVQLPMSRQDIADYLGVTIETVSRTLSSLETAAADEDFSLGPFKETIGPFALEFVVNHDHAVGINETKSLGRFGILGGLNANRAARRNPAPPVVRRRTAGAGSLLATRRTCTLELASVFGGTFARAAPYCELLGRALMRGPWIPQFASPIRTNRRPCS